MCMCERQREKKCVCVCAHVSVSCRCSWTHQRGGFIDRLWVLMISPYLTGIWRDDYANCKRERHFVWEVGGELQVEDVCVCVCTVSLCVSACVKQLYDETSVCGFNGERGRFNKKVWKYMLYVACVCVCAWIWSVEMSPLMVQFKWVPWV